MRITPLLLAVLRVAEKFQEPQPMRVLASIAGVKPQKLALRVFRLRAGGYMVKTGPEAYQITSAGREYLAQQTGEL